MCSLQFNDLLLFIAKSHYKVFKPKKICPDWFFSLFFMSFQQLFQIFPTFLKKTLAKAVFLWYNSKCMIFL